MGRDGIHVKIPQSAYAASAKSYLFDSKYHREVFTPCPRAGLHQPHACVQTQRAALQARGALDLGV